MILLTGGCGFIGSNFILNWLKTSDEPIINTDCLTYAARPANLDSLANDSRYIFKNRDICQTKEVYEILAKQKPRAIIHFAAETHVDKSIDGPDAFIRTNIMGTANLLTACLAYWKELGETEKSHFRFLHISTDEVYGALEAGEPAWTENSRYMPNSPYSASKAASDHLVRSYFKTYGLPSIITHCSNNYGPFQFPEKLIPLVILRCLEGKKIPVYGKGENIRDWIHVQDHCEGLKSTLQNGNTGEVYNFGGDSELNNLQVVNIICQLMDQLKPKASGKYSDLIEFVPDRLGHDFRYAINSDKSKEKLSWKPQRKFETGLEETVQWYLKNYSSNSERG